MKNEEYTIFESFTLPSEGKIYDQGVSSEVQLRSMTTMEEMRRLATSDGKLESMCNIIDDCMVNDTGISSYDMCLGDYLFLFYKLRTVTYGEDYNYQTICPYCGKMNDSVVNLDELEINNKFDEYEKLSTFELPVTKKTIKIGMQTPRMVDLISQKSKELAKKTKSNDYDYSLLYSIYYSIKEIDGKRPDPLNLEDWIKNLPMKDTQTILNYIDKINNLIGLELMSMDTCGGCGRDYHYSFRTTPEFYRPTLVR